MRKNLHKPKQIAYFSKFFEILWNFFKFFDANCWKPIRATILFHFRQSSDESEVIISQNTSRNLFLYSPKIYIYNMFDFVRIPPASIFALKGGLGPKTFYHVDEQLAPCTLFVYGKKRWMHGNIRFEVSMTSLTKLLTKLCCMVYMHCTRRWR